MCARAQPPTPRPRACTRAAERAAAFAPAPPAPRGLPSPSRAPLTAPSLPRPRVPRAALAAGAISDRLFAGRRGPVVCLCCALLCPSLVLLARLQSPALVQLTYLWLGVCAFPVHVLLGLFSREVVSPSISSTAGGFVKMIAQIGGASAGYPLGRLQQTLGWDGVFLVLGAVGLLAAAAAAPLWRTTPAVRIAGRNGTVQDFGAMQRKASKKAL